MRNRLFKIVCVIALLFPAIDNYAHAPEWNDLSVIEQGAESKHSSFIYFPDKQSAIENNWQSSPFYYSLNGKWKFNWSYNPSDRPADFFKLDYNLSNWTDINVPGDWQFQGFDVPIFVNDYYPFPKNPPFAPEDHNPVGSYIRQFSIPSSWDGKEIFLH